MCSPIGSLLACGVLFVVSGPGGPHGPSHGTDDPDSTAYHIWYEALREVEPDPNRGASVQNLVLERDEWTLEMISGDLFLLQPIEGRTVGAVFVGRGRHSFNAPIEVERRQLERFFEADSVVEEIKTAVLFFTDETVAELSSSVDWEPLEPSGNHRREVEEALKYLSDDDGWVNRDLMLPMLNNSPGFFYAHVAESRGDPRVFALNPYDFEEVSLSKKAKADGQQRETVAQFHQQADYETGTSLPEESLDLLRVSHYDIETTIESNLDYTGRTTATLERLATDHQWIPFRLFYELKVDSVKWADGTHASFVRAKETVDMWVDFSSAPSDTTELTFFYEGELLGRFRDMWVWVRSAINWYPIYEFTRLATYEMTFHTDDKFTVLTIGNLVSESENEDDDMITTVWQSPPVRQVTFNVGEFEDHRSEDPRIPNLHVQISDKAHKALMARNLGLLRQTDMAGAVTTDVANSLAFFTDTYGPPAVNEYRATEIPYTHGQAFQGLILLSWTTFQFTSERGYDELFRAHEVAHQWWGVGVRPATYRDTWLSEGFAEFSGLWYMGRATGSLDLFMERLEKTRNEILDRRDEAAPICLGYRTGTSEYPDDYETMVYRKGAWVLHMLRNLFIDLDTGSDDAFEALMRDFYMSFYGGAATTLQFQQMAEAHAGFSMDWFFDQWVHNSAIPTYHFSHNLEELENGEYKATVRVRQERVPDNFRMLVPILIDFGTAGTAWVRVDVNGPLTELELPILPMRPERIVFNPDESVLAETKTEGWRN